MSGELPIILTLILFIAVMIICSIERMDYVAYALLGATISCIVTVIFFPINPATNQPTNFADFFNYIDFEVLFFIICMQIVVAIATKHNLFQWMILKALHITKGDHRKFFYLICTISSFSAAIISDITVAIIFVPLVIRACKILNIKAAPYVFGISFTINIGSIYTPFSSSENILISSFFGLDFLWFLRSFSFFVIPVLILTLIVLDFTMLRKIEPPTERQKRILREIMNPDIVIIDHKKFLLNAIYFISVIAGFIFLSEFVLIVAIFGAVIICILNKISFTEMLAEVDWKVITFFIAIFILIGTMQFNGTFDIIGGLTSLIVSEDNILGSAIIVLLLISVLSGFLAQIPTALVFITLLNNIFESTPGGVPNLILMALLLGINVGSNFLPQGAACDLIALNLAKKNRVEGFNYKTLLKNGSKITIFHIVNSIIFLVLTAIFTGGV
ncbi:MAG: SLC13 family permease [Promethearchaeota archaeon]